jgi:hypothetical protein
MDDDVPEINVSTAPCGDPTNPHQVRFPALVCSGCGADLGATLTARLVAALAPRPEAGP